MGSPKIGGKQDVAYRPSLLTSKIITTKSGTWGQAELG